ncbi:MAG: type II toxin-antitoxin system VapC family toxin [Nitrospinae bacterium]|nr:type II toxin-antitoxin system VapC family toxin [Nitrospinota bacterium]MBI3815318.1 type II toxin-antitoxin system VapC family toxin [Nitrospinota bacterium]
MKKLKLYLDTSVLNFYYANDSPEEKAITQELFREIKSGSYTAYISSTVLEEISRASKQKQKDLLSLIEEFNLMPLELDEEIENLASLYIKHKIIPQKYEEDAVHIAVAVVNDLDVIVSWNFEHIVKLKTKINVNGINKMEGYKEIEIYSPMEVIDYEL